MGLKLLELKVLGERSNEFQSPDLHVVTGVLL